MAGLRVEGALRQHGLLAMFQCSKSRWRLQGAYPKRWLLLSSVLLHAQFVHGTVATSELLLHDDYSAQAYLLQGLTTSVLNSHDSIDFGDLLSNTEFGSQWDTAEYASDNCHRVLHLLGHGDDYMTNHAPELLNLQAAMDFRLQAIPRPQPLSCNLQRSPVLLRRAGQTDADLIFDTGASTSFTNDLSDFHGPYEHINESSCSFTGNTAATARGIVQWQIIDQTGTVQTIETTATYVEKGTRKLFSPQSHFQYQTTLNLTNPAKGFMQVDQSKMVFQDMTGWKLELPLSPDENLPASPLHCAIVEPKDAPTTNSDPTIACLNVLDETNTNLTNAQKDLLLLHQKLGHMGFQWIQALLRIKDEYGTAYLSSTHDKTKSVAPPKCEACNYARMTRRGTGHHEIHRPEHEMAIRKNDLAPGDCTSLDHYASPVKGRLPNTYGRERADEQYCGGSIFVDHASSFVQTKHQRTLGATDTLRSKRLYEQEARSCGVNVLRYHADNGIFTDNAFQEDLTLLGQTMTVSGVGAHHQNGVAERAIQTITTRARAMMLHAALHWPNEAHTNLWPFAMDYAVYLWNTTPNQTSGLSPLEVFCGAKQDTTVLQNAHVWGCPTYILDPKLQDHHKLPKWKPRSRRGQFLGMSNQHASNIGLIRNLQTGFVSPQYHTVTDDKFTTVARADDAVDLNRWYDLVTNHRTYYPDDDDMPPELADEWLDAEELRARNVLRDAQNRAPIPPVAQDPPILQPDPDPAPKPNNEDNLNNNASVEEREAEDSANDVSSLPNPIFTPIPNPEPEHEIVFEQVNSNVDASTDAENTVLFPEDDLIEQNLNLSQNDSGNQDPSPHSPRRNPDRNMKGRNRRYEDPPSPALEQAPRRNPDRQLRGRNRRYEFGGAATLAYGRSLFAGDRQLIFPDVPASPTSVSYSSTVRILCFLSEISQDYSTGADNFTHPLSFAAKVQDEDLPTWDMAMNSTDAEAFWTAMDLEISQLSEKKAWIIVDRETVKKTGQRILGSTWVFRKKRFPDGRLKKIKARICVRGDQQVKGVDVFDTFSPVVQWATVRLMLTLSVSLNLCTQQVDYANAFVQAELESPVYMEMPRGYRQEGKCLQLQRSVYGLREAPLNWYNKMCAGLAARGFEPSDHDSCLFVHKQQKMICITWVDDCLFFAYDETPIDNMITSLKKDFEVDKESDVAGFLGLELKKHDDGSIEILQTGLIDRIIAAMNLDNANGKGTPADAAPIGKDAEGDPREEEWSYPSIIGMLLYLHSNSRPDITFAVSQCARFSRSPTRLHEKALKRIGRYLKETRDKGMLINPKSDLKLDMYCDADFAGLWNHEDVQDPTSVKSRTGYLMTLGTVPVIWSSKLQSTITLSTMEAEYVALSAGMKELIPLRRLLADILAIFHVERDEETKISTVFEDNQSCLILANMPLPRMTPRSKHIAIKYHWFREHVQQGKVVVEKIDTKLQKADIFTKGLRTELFRDIRKMIMGW